MSLPGEQAASRYALAQRFSDRLSTDQQLNRTLVSYQGNRRVPGFRWMKYKEAFSVGLVERFLAEHNPKEVLDPFAGVGTVPLAAVWRGLSGTGIEIMPVGVRVGQAIASAANGLPEVELSRVSQGLLRRLESGRKPPKKYAFPHVNITARAFSQEAEEAIAKARQFLHHIDDVSIKSFLDVACMSVLEAASYTRKDGQYLRWDHRSGRSLRSKFDIGHVVPFPLALEKHLSEIMLDVAVLKSSCRGGQPQLQTGSSLELLRQYPSRKFDMVITSPPYANRYDYTRTYALELAWLGYSREDFLDLRQSLLTATVENKSKYEWLQQVYSNDDSVLKRARKMHLEQEALREVLDILERKSHELSNKHVIRLLDGYFFEMALVIAELGRVVCPGGTVIMVNDNVQYHGEEVPVDFILSDFAEQCGFSCTKHLDATKRKGQREPANGKVWTQRD